MKYEGNFTDDHFNKDGKYYFANGDYYIGNFEMGYKSGKGIIYDKKGLVFYKGEFFLDKFHGFGIKFYPNRNYYQGNFKNNLRDGEGSLFYKNGKPKYKGIFKLGKCDSPNDDFDQDGNDKSAFDKLLTSFNNFAESTNDFLFNHGIFKKKDENDYLINNSIYDIDDTENLININKDNGNIEKVNQIINDI